MRDDRYSITWLRSGVIERTPFTQQLTALLKKLLASAAPSSRIERSSMPTPDPVLFAHHALGDCWTRQFGMCSPGEIVTCLPLTATTVFISVWLRPWRVACELPL